MSLLVVGGGKMGLSHLALATQYIGKSNVALCDSKFLFRLFFKIFGYRTYASVEDALSGNSPLTGVLIATPTPSHAALVNWAIDNNIPFFVEKPLTLNRRLSLKLLRAAKLVNLPTQVGFVMRYLASFQKLKELVDHGELGRDLNYRASMSGNVIDKPQGIKNWKANFNMGGGCLNEYGPHLIDLCAFIFGKISKINSVSYEKIHSNYADDRFFIDWKHENGPQGFLSLNWSDSTKRKYIVEFFVEFEYASIRVDNSVLEIYWPDDNPSVKKKISLEASVTPKNIGFYLRGEEFSLELEDFLSLIKTPKDSYKNFQTNIFRPTLEDGFKVDYLINKIAKKAGLK